MNAFDRQRVDEAERVARKALYRVRAGGDHRLAVAARVVAQHAITRSKRRDLRIPHREIRAERIGQHDDRRAENTIETIVKACVGDIGEWHVRS